MTSQHIRRSRGTTTSGVALLVLVAAACGSNRSVAIGPIPDPDRAARFVGESTRLTEKARIEFRWELNEAGSRIEGVGIARVEPPFRARLTCSWTTGRAWYPPRSSRMSSGYLTGLRTMYFRRLSSCGARWVFFDRWPRPDSREEKSSREAPAGFAMPPRTGWSSTTRSRTVAFKPWRCSRVRPSLSGCA